ncbi:MAG: hypothetical protein EA400_14440 [Chromatiaceae bacterium]|nr:MAG: hypothetical protein EA400_14440 [Chromatiaceae bacterium]
MAQRGTPARRSKEDAAQYLQRLERVHLAHELIERGARQLLVYWATQLPADRLVGLYRLKMNSNAALFPCGSIPRLQTVLRDPYRHAQASVFAGVLLHEQGAMSDQSLSPQMLIRVFDLYRRLDPDPIGITECFFIARDLRTGALAMRWCEHCEVGYLVNAQSLRSALNRCPVCAIARLQVRVGEMSARNPARGNEWV